MTRFARFAAIDWSGAKGRRHKGIAVAVCTAGEAAPALVRPGHAWSRAEVLDWLLAAADEAPTQFGFDFSFAPPILERGEYLPGERGVPAEAKPFWGYVEAACEDEDLGAAEGGEGDPTQAEVDDAQGKTILVTARRREESLQDTPIAISAFSAEALEERQIQTTQDLERITPSLQMKPAGQLSGNSAASVVFIRGVGQLDPTAAVDPGVGIYIDEVYVGRSVGGTIEFGDVASVEVLRGPQGTLFGRNTIGGAILVRTREPEIGQLSGRARFRVGSDDLFEGFAAVNVPLSGTAAARVSAGIRKRDGYVIRAFDGLDLGNEDVIILNGALRWEPAPRFSLPAIGCPPRNWHRVRYCDAASTIASVKNAITRASKSRCSPALRPAASSIRR